MNKKISLGAALAMLVLVAATAVFITMAVSMQMFNTDSSEIGNRTENIAKITEIDKVVRDNYVGQIDEDKLTIGIADGYFKGLDDPHSYYLSADEYTDILNYRTGKSNEIGAYVTDNGDSGLYVYFVMSNSPASKAGMQDGDTITAISGRAIAEIGVEQATEELKSITQPVDITVMREGVELTLQINPEQFAYTTIEAIVMEDIGYIRIYDFIDSTSDQFIDAVETMLKQNVRGFIFDVRHNSGGTLSSVVDMIDRLCPAGDIVSKTDKNGVTTVMHKSDAKEVNLPMIVLVDEETASAAELFACALRDYDKAELVGVQTYGKGSMQELFAFKDGSAINLTTALYNPPKSPNYDGVGITPDHEVELNPAPANFYMMTENEDTQLQYALAYFMQQ